MTEHRSARLAVHEGARRVSGLAVPWGDRARLPDGREETFTAGAFGDNGILKPVPLFADHGGAMVGELIPSNSDRGLEVAGSYEGDLPGDSFSIEFRARRETASGQLRIVHGADLVGVAAVALPAYDGAVIETRDGAGRVKGSLPLHREIECKCRSGGARRWGEVATVAEVVTPADTLAYLADVKKVLGKVRSRSRRRSVELEVALDDDLPAVKELLALVEAGAPIKWRPFPDPDASDYKTDGRLTTWRRLVAQGWILVPGALAGDAPKAEVADRGREVWL